MRQRGIVCLVAVIVTILVAWGISVGPPNIHSTARNFQNFLGIPDATSPPVITTPSSPHKCGLSRRCPVDYFAFHISSGAADVVGPKICFDGKTIMSNVYNNVAHGLNVVLINGENGKVENISTFNMNTGENVLAYLKAIQNGSIVLVASFDDVTRKMTDEMREMFVGLGSTMIKSVKHRDSWVFAGGAGAGEKSPFEKRATSDPKTNIYGAWPEVVEVGGCFPRKL